jgi:5-methylcytosine-specific restriction endonuclease McrA
MSRTFSKPILRAGIERSGGRCEAVGIAYGLPSGQRCNAPLDQGWEADHIIAWSNGGESTLENLAAVCKTCHAWKTGKMDTPRAAKTKRQRDDHLGVRQRSTFPGSRNSRFRKRMDGRVEERKTGEIL